VVRLPSYRSYILRLEEVREEVVDSDLIFWFQGDLGAIQLLFALFGAKTDRKRYFCSSLTEIEQAFASCLDPAFLVLSSSIGFDNIEASLACVDGHAQRCSTLLILKSAVSYSLDRYVKAGVDGFVLEKSIIHQTGALLAFFRSIKSGEPFFDPSIYSTGGTHDRARGVFRLTDREFRVLTLLSRGYTNEEISSAIGCSTYTARDHVNRILHKFGVANRTAAVVFAMRNDIL
jgi:DNA-binding NarL/FixJ family response regulator